MNEQKVLSAKDLMPKSSDAKEILESRSVQLAIKATTDHFAEQQSIYLQFKLNDGNLYGIPQVMLDAVIDADKVSPINWLPPFISGVINWKGIILTVLDTNYINAEVSIEQQATDCKILVVSNANKQMGLLVNKIDGFINYKPANLKTSVQSPIKFNPDYFLGLLDDSVVLFNINDEE